MPSLMDSSLEEKVQRLREIAAGLTNPADRNAVRRYAAEVEADEARKKERTIFTTDN